MIRERYFIMFMICNLGQQNSAMGITETTREGDDHVYCQRIAGETGHADTSE